MIDEIADKKVSEARELADIPDNFGRMWELISEAAKLGHPEAIYAQGSWYLHGKYVNYDPQRGMDLLWQAAALGSPDAHFELADALEEGENTEKSERRAFEHLVRAMALGHRLAIFEIGRFLYYNIGIESTKDAANVFMDIAIEFGVEPPPVDEE